MGKRLGAVGRFVVLALMVLACLVFARMEVVPEAAAGERFLGKMEVYDAGTTSNRCTGYVAYASPTAFVVPPKAKISIQCDSASHVLTDVANVDAGRGIALAAGQFFTTSINGAQTLSCRAFNSDGGSAGHIVTYTGSWVTMSADSASATCNVYERDGFE